MTEQIGVLVRDQLQQLIDLIIADGYCVLGPQLIDGALQFADLKSIDQFPVGKQVRQSPGNYCSHDTGADRFFDIVNGPQALKPLLFVPRETLWRSVQLDDGSLAFYPPEHDFKPLALIGVRSCDLAALQLQDQHFLQGDQPDPAYKARRRGLLLIAVNCAQPADTCFCVSTGDGPFAEQGYDLCLTELDDGFLVQVGSVRGEQLYEQLPLRPASDEMLKTKESQHKAAVESQQRKLPSITPTDLQKRSNHPHWAEIGDYCLACGNCTMVCPTCFCHHEQPLATLQQGLSETRREWDSCFSEQHGYLAGHQVRPDITSRYRQWVTHKLDSWQTQYGRSGCVGCGRCISWCPVGIDLVAEANRLMEDPE